MHSPNMVGHVEVQPPGKDYTEMPFPDSIPWAVEGKAGVTGASEDTGRSGYAFLNAEGKKIGGVYDTAEEAAKHGPGFQAAQKR